MHPDSYSNLAKFGKKVLDSTALEEGLPLIAEYSSTVLGAERCSIFVYDEKKNELWTTVADSMDRIIIDAKQGIVGRTLDIKHTIIENDVESNPYFMKEIDQISGFKTRNIIATPVFSSKQKVIAVLELLNKEGGFNAEDEKYMHFFAHFISGFIELAPINSDTVL